MSVIIDTNNFKQVLLYFNHEGELADKQDTRVAIDCAICREKQLAIVNPNFDQLGNDTHEPYIVLPLCGHAFGAKCLLNWLDTGNETCPCCRKPVVFENKQQIPAALLEPYGNRKSQATDIRLIRHVLKRCLTHRREKLEREMKENSEEIEEYSRRIEECNREIEDIEHGHVRTAEERQKIGAQKMPAEPASQVSIGVSIRAKTGSDDRSTIPQSQRLNMSTHFGAGAVVTQNLNLNASIQAGPLVTTRVSSTITIGKFTRASWTLSLTQGGRANGLI